MTFRVTIKDTDGNLIVNRETDKALYTMWYGEWDRNFAEYSLKRDCREKGVNLISFDIDDDGVHAIARY